MTLLPNPGPCPPVEQEHAEGGGSRTGIRAEDAGERIDEIEAFLRGKRRAALERRRGDPDATSVQQLRR